MRKSIKIDICGTDGAGKTTGMKYMLEKMRAAGLKVLETREVGNPNLPICVKLRELVLSPESNLSGEAMELIFSAMRIENDKFYRSVDHKYDFIISDRGWFSHLAYTDHNVSEDFTKDLYLKFISKYTKLPDIVVYFSVNTETALHRRAKRNLAVDVIEAKGITFQENVRKSFEKYMTDARLHTPSIIILKIDANEDMTGVQAQIDSVIEFVTGSVEINLTANA